MIALARGQAVGKDFPALLFISQSQGQIVPAQSLSFRILRMANEDEELDPEVVQDTTTIDLTNDLVVLDVNNQTAGFYAAPWTVPGDAPIGRYAIEWTFKLTNPSSSILTSVYTESPPQGVVRKPFEVVAGPPMQLGAPPIYSLVCDARAALGCGSDVSDVNLLRILGRASRMIDRVTGRTFSATFANMRYSGNSSRKLPLNQVIIGSSSVGIDTQPTQLGDLIVELDLFRVYNRHLSQGMLGVDDDRNAPMLEFVHSDDLYGIRFVPFRGISLRSLAWPIGVQNIHVRGVWGYTDPDGSPWGETPELIQHVCRLIAAREIPKLGSDEREDAQWRWRVKSEKSRDVSIEMVDARKWGEWFGDPEIDSILASFVRPAALGSA